MKKLLYTILGTACLSSCAHINSTANRDVSVVVTADTHFDMPPETDQYYHVVAINNLVDHFQFNKQETPNRSGSILRKIDGVIIAGDLFDKADPKIIDLYKKRWEKGTNPKQIHYLVYPGLGNHDLDPYSDDSIKNAQGRALNLQYMDSLLSAKLAQKEIVNLDPSSRAYSWNIQDVHFIQAQCCVGITSYCEDNFEWLEADLKTYASDGEPVVYIQHYGFDQWALKWWPETSRKHLFDILEQYNLIAFFVGHTHVTSVQHYRGHKIYQVNNAWKDGDGYSSFAVMHISNDSLEIETCKCLDGEGHFEVADLRVVEKIQNDK